MKNLPGKRTTEYKLVVLNSPSREIENGRSSLDEIKVFNVPGSLNVRIVFKIMDRESIDGQCAEFFRNFERISEFRLQFSNRF